MNASSLMRPGAYRRARGVAIITAIFMLVVVAGLGVAVVSMTTAQQSASAIDVLGQRAYQAARAGIEWGVYRANRPLAAPTPATSLGCAAGPNSFGLPGTTFTGFVVTVSCFQVSGEHVEIQSVACNQPTAAGACPNAAPGPDYVQRVIRAQL